MDQFIRCRIFPDRDHDPQSPLGHGLDRSQAWVEKTWQQARLWRVPTEALGPMTTAERQRQYRMTQQIAEDLVCLVEIEGEKIVRRDLLDQARLRADNETERSGASRSLKFLVDGQLDLVVSLAHVVVNLVARVVASHPRWHVADYASVTSDDARRFETNQSGVIPEVWISANAKAATTVGALAETTADPKMVDLAKALADVVATSEWVHAIKVRGKRHHRDGRSLPEGVNAMPSASPTGGAYGGGPPRFHNEHGVIDSDKEAIDRIDEADTAASDAVKVIAASLEPLRKALEATLNHLDDPELLTPWSSPEPRVPATSASGRPFPYRFYIELDANGLRTMRQSPLWDGFRFHLVAHDVPTIEVLIDAPSFDEAVEDARTKLGELDVVLQRAEGALGW